MNNSQKFKQFMVQALTGVVISVTRLNAELNMDMFTLLFEKYVNDVHKSIVFEDDVYINNTFGDFPHSPDCLCNAIYIFGNPILQKVYEEHKNIVEFSDNIDEKRIKNYSRFKRTKQSRLFKKIKYNNQII